MCRYIKLLSMVHRLRSRGGLEITFTALLAVHTSITPPYIIYTWIPTYIHTYIHTYTHTQQRAVELAGESGDSAWITTLPLWEFGFNLHKRAFRDDLHTTCICGKQSSVEHALSCPRKCFSYQTSEVCHKVRVELDLQPVDCELTSGHCSEWFLGWPFRTILSRCQSLQSVCCKQQEHTKGKPIHCPPMDLVCSEAQMWLH